MLTCVKLKIESEFCVYICLVNALKLKRIIYLITATAIITIATQVYRNVQNYDLNKERFIQDMQRALDVSIDSYFADLVRQDIMYRRLDTNDTLMPGIVFRGAWTSSSDSVRKTTDWSVFLDSLSLQKGKLSKVELDSPVKKFGVWQNMAHSSVAISDSILFSQSHTGNVEIKVTDSLEQIKGFAKKIIISLTNSNLNLEALKSHLQDELNRRNLRVNHVMVLYKSVPIGLEVVESSNKNGAITFNRPKVDTLLSEPVDDLENYPLDVFSKSTFLTKNQRLQLRFENASLAILKRGGLDLLISLVISFMVIGSLLYLYRVISEQKELAEIKNDLISNITHEFKTPIATISTALEGISNFNEANDPVKTSKYLDISKDQLGKLNGMVEKLLETASLDSDDLEISLEEVEVVPFTRQIYERYYLIKGDKKLSFKTDLLGETAFLDVFHMENAIGNLLDNAIKYGGNQIELELSASTDKIAWRVTDNGGHIGKQEQQRIFDKFYRIPTGNVHNVKGFGIGLFYTKSLVEKHSGEVTLSVQPGKTTFIVEVPHGKA